MQNHVHNKFLNKKYNTTENQHASVRVRGYIYRVKPSSINAELINWKIFYRNFDELSFKNKLCIQCNRDNVKSYKT